MERALRERVPGPARPPRHHRHCPWRDSRSGAPLDHSHLRLWPHAHTATRIHSHVRLWLCMRVRARAYVSVRMCACVCMQCVPVLFARLVGCGVRWGITRFILLFFLWGVKACVQMCSCVVLVGSGKQALDLRYRCSRGPRNPRLSPCHGGRNVYVRQKCTSRAESVLQGLANMEARVEKEKRVWCGGGWLVVGAGGAVVPVDRNDGDGGAGRSPPRGLRLRHCGCGGGPCCPPVRLLFSKLMPCGCVFVVLRHP